MIRHIVLARFRTDVPDAERQAIFDELAGLQSVVAIKHFAAGANVSPEPLSKGYTHGFTIDFEDASARDAYLVHPAHQAAGGRLVAAAEGGVEGVLVLDFEI